MMRRSLLLVLPALLLLAGSARAAEPPVAAEGVIEKVGKGTITVQPRAAGGRFGKAVVLRVTGTSNLSTVSIRKQGGKEVVVQRKLSAEDLKAKQAVAVIYTTVKDGNVLLAAVVHSAKK
jgi:hypothetical protein